MERRKLKPGYHYMTIGPPPNGLHSPLCPIAMLDALGFSNAMEQGDICDVYRGYMGLLLNAESGLPGSRDCGVLVFSDTVFLVPSPDARDCLQTVVEKVGSMIHNSVTCLEFGFPLRGAVSFGPVMADFAHEVAVEFEPPLPVPQSPVRATVILGEPVISAYRWEKLQKWVGASLAPESIGPLDGAFPETLRSLRNRNKLLDWDVPTELGPVPSLAINYVSRISAEILEKVLSEAERRAPNLAVRSKYHAALIFVRHVIKHCLFSRTGIEEREA